MRVEITCDGKRIEAATRRLGTATSLFIEEAGIEGWHSAPAPQQEGEAVPAGGAAWPPLITPSARVVTVHLASDSASALEAAQINDLLNGFFGKAVEIAVTDASGRRTAQGYLSDQPTVAFTAFQRKLIVDLIVTCPDPNRYGAWASYDVTHGATILQGGNAPSYPVVEASGACTALTVEIDGRTLKWSGTGPVSIDFRTGKASTGTVTVDDAAPLEPGRNSVEVSAAGAGSVTLRCRPAWR